MASLGDNAGSARRMPRIRWGLPDASVSPEAAPAGEGALGPGMSSSSGSKPLMPRIPAAAKLRWEVEPGPQADPSSATLDEQPGLIVLSAQPSVEPVAPPRVSSGPGPRRMPLKRAPFEPPAYSGPPVRAPSPIKEPGATRSAPAEQSCRYALQRPLVCVGAGKPKLNGSAIVPRGPCPSSDSTCAACHAHCSCL
jgi:hypothetical protein